MIRHSLFEIRYLSAVRVADSVFNHLGFNYPPLAVSRHSGESRNPVI